MRANKGFTLLEVAVVLAVIAVLAAILTPVVTSYIDQARSTRAQSDVKKIAEAINLFKRDTGVYPGYNVFSEASSGATLTGDTNGLTGCLLSGSSAVTSTQTIGAWSCVNAGLLETYLNINSLGISINTGLGGRTAFRGPYLDGLSGTDPWGSAYAVNSSNFASASTSWAYAVSAGPDGVIDTAQNPPKTAIFVASDDDIAAMIK